MGTATKTIQYRYDAVGNRVGLTDPDGGQFTYAYDSVRRISHLENPQNERTTYAYDAGGRRTLKKLANGTRASFSYDDASNLTRLANLKSDGTTISSFDYAYDKTGNRTAVLEADGSRVTWSYDDTYQLTGEHRTGSNAYRNTFTYDAAGNRTLKSESGQRTTYAYDAANQLQTAQAALGTTTYTFDADGNQQIVQPPTGNRTTTTWDYENRTTLVELASGLRNTMAYEPDGLRIKLEDSTGTKKFVWDDQNYLAETDENDDTQVVYTNEPAVYGNLISQRRGSTTNWYHFDALGSTRELTIVSEAVSDTYLYDAWGVPIASTGSTINPFQFVGKLGYYFDTGTGNNYIRARIYRPNIVRWNSRDPLSKKVLILLLHAYTYTSNSPATRHDPSGRVSQIKKQLCNKAFPGPKGVPIIDLDADMLAELANCFTERNPVRCINDVLNTFDFTDILDNLSDAGKEWLVKLVCCNVSGGKRDTDPCQCGNVEIVFCQGRRRVNKVVEGMCFDPADEDKRFDNRGCRRNYDIRSDKNTCNACCDYLACIEGASLLTADLKELLKGIVTGTFNYTQCQQACT